MVSIASLESVQVASWVRLLHAIGVGMGAGVGVGVAVAVGVGEAVPEGGLNGAGDGLMLSSGDEGRALSSNAVMEPVPMRTTRTIRVTLGLGSTKAQRVPRQHR
jgi:hypothetical protein